MRSILLVSVLLILITSCKTSFRISVKEPAVIELQDSLQSFAIVNNVNKENSPEEVIGTMLGTEQINGNVAAGERAVDGVLRALDRSNTLRGDVFDSDSLRGEDGEIDWIYLDSIANENGYHGYIELSEVRSMSPVGGTVMANLQGKTSARLNGSLTFNVYVANSHEKYERFTVNDYYNVPLSGSTSLLAVLSDMKRKREYYKALGFELGYEAGRLIYPNWVWVNRTFFSKGNKTIRRAKPMIKKGNWGIAEQVLTQDVNHPNDRVRGRILYNIALTLEGQGEVDLAVEYAEKAAVECGNKLANDYLVKLRKRQRQIADLND